jgi:putative tryptophan/tyrosine transport system substrate-binding protein
MDRRSFIGRLAGGLLATPLSARAQRQAVPAIGFLRTTPSGPFADIVVAFRQGLNETGFVEGQNVAVEYRWADNHLDRLPRLATDLVRRQVAVIVGNSLAAEAAKAVSTTIPIVFVTDDDPVTRGLVTSLSHPGGNVTGITFFGGGELAAKRLELLHELVPGATVVAFLMDPNSPGSRAVLPDVEAAARIIGQLRIVVVKAASERELEPAFATMVQANTRALMVSGSPLFTSLRRQLIALAARHAIPAIYDVREYVEAGGLISYAGSFTAAYRQAGMYAGRILKGDKPAEMPVSQPTKFELVVNRRTAKALAVTIPQSLFVRADQVIQ